MSKASIFSRPSSLEICEKSPKMRLSSRTWFIISLVSLLGAALFAKLGNNVRNRHQAPVPRVLKPAAVLPRTTPFPLLALESANAQALARARQSAALEEDPATSNPSSNPSSIVDKRFPFRLRNTAASLDELSRKDSAILLKNAFIDTSDGRVVEVPEILKSTDEPGSYVVQAKELADEFFRAQVREVSGEVIAYIPNNAYLVRMNSNQARALQGRSRVRAVLPFEPYYKLDYSLLPMVLGPSDSDASVPLRLGLFPGSAEAARVALSSLGLEVRGTDRSPFGPVWTVDAVPGQIALIAGLSTVQSVEVERSRMPMNDRSRVLMGLAPNSTNPTNSYLGLNGTNVWINVNDSGVDATHRDLAGRVFSLDAAALTDTNGHGTHVAGVIAGSGVSSTNITALPSGSEAGAHFRGVAPGAKLFVQRVSLTTGPLTSDSILQETAARTNYVLFKKTNPMISNNSWGYTGARDYDLAAASYDAAVRDALPEVTGGQPMIYVFAAGNGGFGGQDGLGGEPDGLVSPATAKNVISVGALELRRRITNEVVVKDPNDPSRFLTNKVFENATDTDDQVASFSSRGNVGIGQEGAYGRFKPDVVAPGAFVISTRAKGWTNATSEPVPQVSRFPGQVIGPGQRNDYVVFIPDNAIGFEVEVLSNPGSPSPLPALPIYVAYNRSPSDSDFVRDSQVQLPRDRSLNPGQLHFSIGNRTDRPVPFDLITILTTTNATGTYFQELGKLNDSLAPSYRFDSGTSVSAGAVSGMLALMQQFFESNKVAYSPALMKALLINGAKSANTIYDFQVANTINYQGWGGVSIENSIPLSLSSNFNQTTPSYFLESGTNNALATGQSVSWKIDSSSASAQAGPLRLTLVWTDPPGNPSAAIKLVNDLDLVVSNTVTKEVFYGNLIPEGSDFTPSIPSGTTNSGSYSDVVNNVENVYVGHPRGNDYVVTVAAKRVNVNALTTHPDGVVQDFALVASIGGEPVRLVSQPRLAPVRTELLYPTNGAPLLSQRAGANSPLQGGVTVPNNGVANQWSFYVFTNVFSTNQPNSSSLTNGENVAFITFVPPNLSKPRNFDADIDLYVSRNPAITNLDAAALAAADRSRGRGGTETVVYTNAPVGPNAIFYIAVKSEDQEGAEYGFVALSSNEPFERTDEFGNRILTAMPPVVEIPDGSASQPGGAYMFAVGITPSLAQRVTVSADFDHGNIGDLAANLSHDRQFVVLNNHNSDGGFIGPFHRFVFDDSNSGMFFGSQPSDGPGSLSSFQGSAITGAWIVTIVDNQLSHSGRVNRVELLVEPSALESATGVNSSVLANRFTYFFVDVPPDASLLEVILSQNTAPLNVYLLKAAQPTLAAYDKFAAFNPPGGTLTLGTRDVPPLSAGRYYIGIFNPNATTVNFNLRTRLERALSQAFSKSPTVTTPLALSDDVVQYATNVVDDARPLTDVRVGVRIDHARLSDLGLRLISPQGKKVLLMENRGGASTREIGSQSVTTNFHHVALTYDRTNGTASLFLDGELSVSKLVGTFEVDTRDDLFIGRQPTTNQFSAPFVGVLDEVGLYNRALAPSEIRAIHRFGSSGKNLLGLAANWSFENNGNDSRTNNPAQIVGGGFVPGKEGRGFYLPPEAYARATNTAGLNVGLGGGFTVDAWINPAELSTNRTLVLWSDGTNRVGTSFSIIPGLAGAANPGVLSATLVGRDGTNRVVAMEQQGLIQTNAVATNFVFTVFNESTNVAKVPIKFAQPPYVTNAAAAQVYLGGFEVTATNVNTVFAPLTTLDGWAVRSNQVSVLNLPALAHTGSNSLALVRGSIGRTLPTEAGRRYELKFVHRHQPDFEGVVASWPGERSSSDLVGFSDGIATGPVAYTNGIVGDAFFFAAPGAAVSVADNVSLRLTNELTVEFWFNRLSASTTSGSLLMKRTEPVGNVKGRANYGVDLHPVRGLGFWFDDPAVDGPTSDDFGLTTGVESLRVPAPSAGTFHHFVGTFKQIGTGQVDGSIYIDGKLVKSKRLPGSLSNTLSEAPVVIGSLSTNLANYSVIIDESTLFARALSEQEVALIYSLGSVGKCPYPCTPETQLVLDGESPVGFFSSGDWATNNYAFTAKTQGTPIELSALEPGAMLDSFEMREVFSRDYLPEETLKEFVGESAAGLWRLEMTDTRSGPGPSGPPSELIAWQLLLSFAPTNYSAVTLTNGVTYSNLVASGQSLYFIVEPPRSATRVTNTLSALSPLDLVFNQNGLPVGGPATGDVTLLRSATTGISLIATNGTTQMDTNNSVVAASGVPKLAPGQRYYLGLKNSGIDAPFSIRVDFDRLDAAISGLTELRSGQTILTNIPSTNALHYYRFNVATNTVAATFGVYPTNGNVNLYIRRAQAVVNPLPTPNQYDYASENPGALPEIITVDRNSVVPLTAGDWYLGVQNVDTNLVNYSILVQESAGDSSTNVVRLLDSQEVAALTGGAPGLSHVYVYTADQDPAKLLFELFNLTANADLVAKRGAIPSATDFDFSSQSAGSADEQIVILTSELGLTLNGDWYLGVLNRAGAPIAYSIRAVAARSGALIGARPARLVVSFGGGAGGLQFAWNSIRGERYRIEVSPDLMQWTELTTVTATGPQTQFDGPALGAQNQFFRIIQIP